MFKKLLCLILIFSTNFAIAAPALVVDVVDGDTIKVADQTGVTVIRLYGIDTPEKKQSYGPEAKKFTEDMVEGKVADITKINTDRYGRSVAIVKVGDQCLQEQLLVSGYAWLYTQYCKKKFCPAWEAMQKIAASNKWGLWIDPAPVQPWVWRKHH